MYALQTLVLISNCHIVHLHSVITASTALHLVIPTVQSCFTRVANMTSRRRLRSSASHRLEEPPVRLNSRPTGFPSWHRSQHVERPSVPHHIFTVHSHSRVSDSVSRLSYFLVPIRTSWYDLLINNNNSKLCLLLRRSSTWLVGAPARQSVAMTTSSLSYVAVLGYCIYRLILSGNDGETQCQSTAEAACISLSPG